MPSPSREDALPTASPMPRIPSPAKRSDELLRGDQAAVMLHRLRAPEVHAEAVRPRPPGRPDSPPGSRANRDESRPTPTRTRPRPHGNTHAYPEGATVPPTSSTASLWSQCGANRSYSEPTPKRRKPGSRPLCFSKRGAIAGGVDHQLRAHVRLAGLRTPRTEPFSTIGASARVAKRIRAPASIARSARY